MCIHFQSNSKVAEAWVKQSPCEGKGSNFFFRGKTIYSYGEHFPVAEFVSDDTVAITMQHPSVTTGMHTSMVRKALCSSPYKVINVIFGRQGVSHDATIAAHTREIKKCIDKAKSARINKEFWLKQHERCVKEACDYARHYDLNYKFE